MTVKELINKLKKMPLDAQVYWSDHDHGVYEHNARLGSVSLLNQSHPEAWGIDDQFKIEGDYISLRP